MGKFIDLIGKKFGKLIVTKFAFFKKKRTYWHCKCDCGKETVVRGDNLKSGLTNSCGCERGNFKHGYRRNRERSKIYVVWNHMIQRCTNPKNLAYKNYGKREITVCDRWNCKKGGSFENFLEDMGICPSGLTLDRINNDDGYYKENCRWVTSKINNRNKRSNHLIPYDGKKLCIAEWSEITGIHESTIWQRINDGWTPEETLTTPVKNNQ